MNRQKKLFALPKFELKSGGTRSHLKERRAFVARKPIHLVFRSHHAKGRLSLLAPHNVKHVDRIIKYCKHRFHVQVLEYVNVGNHMHLKIKASERDSLRNFLRTLTALIARAVTGACRGKEFRDANGVKARFWAGTLFTRVLTTYFEEKVLKRYFDGNFIESIFGTEVRESFFAMTPFPIPKRLKFAGTS